MKGSLKVNPMESLTASLTVILKEQKTDLRMGYLLEHQMVLMMDL